MSDELTKGQRKRIAIQKGENTIPTMKIISLKTINPFFTEVWEGRKNFEVRLNDRDFCKGDVLQLQEFNPDDFKGWTGREVLAFVDYILTDKEFPQGLQPRYVCMSITVIKKIGA